MKSLHQCATICGLTLLLTLGGCKKPYVTTDSLDDKPAGIDPKVFGRPTGVMGFRLFDNPDFKGAAVDEWKKHIDPATGEATKFYNDANFAAKKDLVRPYRVGVSCGSCHIAYHPCHPP